MFTKYTALVLIWLHSWFEPQLKPAECREGLVFWKTRCRLLHIPGHPPRKGGGHDAVRPRRCVLFADRRQPARPDFPRTTCQSRPESPMDIGHLPVNEPAHQHIAGSTNGPRQAKNGVRLRVCPPAPMDPFASDPLSQAWNRSMPGFKDNAMSLHKS